MIEWNLKVLGAYATFQKNVLYKINDSQIVKVCEWHKDNENIEVVNLIYNIKENQYAIFGHEYRHSNVSQRGCKTADVLTCLIDDEKKTIYSLILDIKRNISAFSDDLLKDNAMLTAIKDVRDFVEQLQQANLHKESFLVYHKNAEYRESIQFGITTQSFEEKKFVEVAEFLDKLLDLEQPECMQPLVWTKYKTSLMPYRSEVNRLRNFANRVIEISGKSYMLSVYLIEKASDSEYAVAVEVGQE